MSTLRTHFGARLGLVQICLAGVLWGTGGLVLQIVRSITPMSVLTVSAYRMLIAAAALLAVLALVGRLRDLRLDLRTVIVGAATGLPIVVNDQNGCFHDGMAFFSKCDITSGQSCLPRELNCQGLL